MKCSFMIASLLLPCLLCACGSTNPAGLTAAEAAKDCPSETSEADITPVTIGPVTEFTLENQIENVENTYQNVCGSFAEMQELAASETASRKGRKSAAKVEKNYAARIEELSEIDFSRLTTDELLSLSVELTDMITAIRKARDALTFG